LTADETIARVLAHKDVLGITRVANLTGLDRTGVLVVMVCRPNARSSAVFNGKGVDIAAAKANHKVWVNLETGIYHKGGRWYGKTKNGKFISVDDAKKAGYKAAKRD